MLRGSLHGLPGRQETRIGRGWQLVASDYRLSLRGYAASYRTGFAQWEQAAMTTETRKFHLSDVLTVTTGLVLSNRHMEGVYDILNYMTGESLFTHQLPRAMVACRPSLFR